MHDATWSDPLFIYFSGLIFSEQAAVLALLVRYFSSKFDVQHAFKEDVHFDKHWLQIVKPLFHYMWRGPGHAFLFAALYSCC